MNKQDVISAWIQGNIASTERARFSTDGRKLFSYELVIGYTDDLGQCFVFDYTSGAESFVSQTTSCHVGLAKRAVHLDNIINPRESDHFDIPSYLRRGYNAL